VTSLLFNTVGISFRVFLSNKIGTEGIGLFQLIISVYMMAILFVVTGINVAVTRLVAEEGGRGSFSVSRALIIRAFSISFLFSIPAFAFLFFGAEYIGTVWLGDQRAIFSLKLLAVGMPFAGISACIKGYFYAVSKLVRPTSSQAVELAIQIFITVNILDYFMLGGPEYACAAVAVGITISELASCLYILTFYRLERRKNDNRISEIFYQNRILKKLLYISFPISVGSLIRSSLKTMENIMIPIGFERYGYTRKLSLEEYGKIQGMVMPILMFPASIILAFSALLIPEVSEANALNQKKRVEYSVTRALQLTSVMSILISGIFVIFSERLGPAIYASTECGSLIKVMAPLIPLIYLDIITDELLKGLNQQVSALKYNTFGAVIKIVLIYYTLPIRGLPGLIFVMYISSLINTALSIRRLLSITHLRLKLNDWILKPILSITASGFVVIFLLDAAGIASLPNVYYIMIGAVSAGILYFILLVKLGALTKDDFKWYKIIFKYSFSRG
jgi:stage V sporulation protein B